MGQLPRCCALTVLFGLMLSSLGAVELAPLENGSAAQLTTLGNMELGQGRYETAIQHYRSALKVDKTYLTAKYNLGLAYQQLGQVKQAREWYEESLKVSPDQPDVLCNLGYLEWLAGNWQGAADRFQEAARLAISAPVDAAQYWTNVGSAREKLQQFPAALRAYQEALALNNRSYQAHYNLGTLYLAKFSEQSGAVEKAQAHLQQATELDPDRPDAWLNLAQCQEITGTGTPTESYATALKVATGVHAKMANQALWQRALFYNRIQPPQKVAMREDLKKILADQPNFPAANGLLGAYYYALGEYAKAMEFLEREVDGTNDDRTNPVDLESHYLLAVIYAEHLSEPAKAIAHATAYYQMRPDSQKIHELRRRALRLSSASAVTEPAPAEGAGETAPAGEGAAHGEKPAAPNVHGEKPAAEVHAAPAAHGEAGAGKAHGEPTAEAHAVHGEAAAKADKQPAPHGEPAPVHPAAEPAHAMDPEPKGAHAPHH